MRIKWILAGVFGTSAIAAASPSLQFYTVINEGDSIAGDQFFAADQVVVGDGGVVGMVGALLNSGNNIVIYSTPAAGNTWNSQSVVETDAQYESFDNLALTGNPLFTGGLSTGQTRLTFAAVSPSDQAGILQWDDNAGVTSLGDVAFEGDGKGYSSIGSDGTDSGGGTLEMQVNGSGQVLFPAVASPPALATSTDVLALGDVSSVPTATPIFKSSSPGLAISDPGSRVALGADGSGAALLSNSGTPGVYNIPAGGGTPTPVSLPGSLVPIHDTPDFQGEPVMGYASSLNATLVLATNSSSTSDDIVLSKNGSPSILVGPFTPGSGAPGVPQGEMSPDGRIAVYVPDNSGADDTIQYADAASLSPVATPVASIGEPALDSGGTSRIIEAVQEAGLNWVPQINDSGTIAFLAEVSTSLTDLTPETALLDWQPGDLSPTVLLWENETVNIGGQPETISDLYFNQLAEENDFYKNALSDDGYLAVGVAYDDYNGAAVLITQVPEPATMALLPIIGVGLLARRKRQR
ncbi:MAG: PEP-CTERM sorting domain-containing protein [Tepidisphaeraceae bacterium]|jgi:hypothetical protein